MHLFLRIAARNTDCRPTKQPIEKQIFYLSVSGLFVSNKRKIAEFCVLNTHGPGWLKLKNVVVKVYNFTQMITENLRNLKFLFVHLYNKTRHSYICTL